MQLIITAITEQQLQEGEFRESNNAAILRRRLPGFDGYEFAFFNDQPQSLAVKADLDLAAMPRGNRLSQPLLERRLDMVQEARQVWHAQILCVRPVLIGQIVSQRFIDGVLRPEHETK